MIIGLLLTLIALIIVAGVVVPSGTLGKFERERRQQEAADVEVEREIYYSDIVSLQHALEALLIVSMSAFSVASLGWLIGILVAVVIALEYGALARFSYVRRASAKLYRRLEPKLFVFIARYPTVMRYIRIFTPDAQELHLHSREELEHLVETSQGVISAEEKKLLLAGLSFSDKLVKEVMTPRSMIDSINKVELLGPLVLDDLHKKGHSRFPVIENDVDHVVGILHLRDILTLDTNKKHTSKVETAMEAKVFYAHEDQTLQHALSAFIKTHHHLFVVVNEYRETVGLLSLEDVIEAMIGREIIDEFDTHDDLRVVAARNPRANNDSKASHDV